MRILRRTWYIILLSALYMSAAAQPVYEEASTEGLDITYRIWTEQHGLPSRDITGLFQDSHGFIWMQAASYILRFDGTQFVS